MVLRSTRSGVSHFCSYFDRLLFFDDREREASMHLRAGEPNALTWSAGSVLLLPVAGRTKARPVSRQPDQYAVDGRRAQIPPEGLLTSLYLTER